MNLCEEVESWQTQAPVAGYSLLCGLQVFHLFFINLYWSIAVFFKLTFITSILGLVFQRLEYWIDPLTLTYSGLEPRNECLPSSQQSFYQETRVQTYSNSSILRCCVTMGDTVTLSEPLVSHLCAVLHHSIVSNSLRPIGL